MIIAFLLLSAAHAQTAGAAIYEVPDAIPDDCSVPVEQEIMAWLATVPDGNTARFGPGGCYGQDGAILVSGRADLVIDGQDSEFRGPDDRRQPPRELALHRRSESQRAGRGRPRKQSPGAAINPASSGSTASRWRACRA